MDETNHRGTLPGSIDTSTLLQAVIDAVPTPIFFKNSEGKYLGCNLAFESYVGRTRGELIGRTVHELWEPHLADVYERADRELSEQGGRQVYEGNVRYADGSLHDVVFHKAVFNARDDGVVGIVGAMLDITERKRAEAHIRQLALRDSLTGISNRRAFETRLAEAFARSRRNGDLTCLMMLDLDGFKHINDRFGHPVGDHVLREVAQRLERVVREVDLVSRIGGDEFAVVLEGLSSPSESRRVAESIVNAVSEPIPHELGELHVGASVGVAHFPLDSETLVGLMGLADQAMYASKARGKGCFTVTSLAP